MACSRTYFAWLCVDVFLFLGWRCLCGGLLPFLLRVACVVGVAVREVQAVCCSLGLENEKYGSYEKSVCVCWWVWFEKARDGIKCTYAFVRSGNSAVSVVRTSVVCVRGCWEVALVVHLM